MAIYPWEQSFWTEKTIAAGVLLFVLSAATSTGGQAGGVGFFLGQLFGLVVMLALVKNGILLIRSWRGGS